MRLRALVVVLLAGVALAGETYLGTTEVCAPAACTNFYSDGGGFVVPASQKLTVWCTAGAFVSVGAPCVGTLHSDGGSDAGVGIPLAASSLTDPRLFPTSTNPSPLRCFLSLDGGAWGGNGGAVLRTAGPSSGVCNWYVRNGSE